jgi:DNA-binding transcriptional regulator YiaG
VTPARRSPTFSSQAAQPNTESFPRFLRATVARQLLPLSRRAPLARGEEPSMEDNAGNLIRGLRQKLGMTQEEFAHEIAVTVSTVNRWENAHAEPSKLAWKAIQDLARKRGLPDDFARQAALEN